MKLTNIGIGACVLFAGLLCACEDARDTGSGRGHLGDSKEGAPVVTGPTDRGILEDPTTYQPTKPPAATTGGPSGSPTAGAKPTQGDAAKAAEDLVRSLRKFIEAGEVEQALKLFNAEHVAALLAEDKFSPMQITFERLDRLAKQVSPEQATIMKSMLVGFTPTAPGAAPAEPKIDPLNGEHVSVTPNLGVILFGPRAERALNAAKGPDGWRFQLESPLTPGDVDAILAFHKKLQDGLGAVADYLTDNKNPDPLKVTEILTQALTGQAVEVPAGDAADKPADQEPNEPNAAEPAAPNTAEPNSPAEPNDAGAGEKTPEPDEPNQP